MSSRSWKIMKLEKEKRKTRRDDHFFMKDQYVRKIKI